VATYLLVSGDPGRNAANRAKLEAFAKEHGTIVLRSEEPVADRKGRRQLKRLLARARQGTFDVLCVLAVGTVAPSRRGALRVAQQLATHAVRVASSSEPWWDLESPALKWIAEGDRRLLERSADALDARRRKGMAIGTAPLGYQRMEDGTLAPDPHEEDAIERALELWAENYSMNAIAQILTSEGFESRTGGPISHVWVSRIIARHVNK
jgi:DNA invertase Pin-like site-specific DNA recombinase